MHCCNARSICIGLLFVWMTETVLRGEARMFASGDARWLGERRRVPQNKPFSPRAAGVFGYVISNLAPPDPFHLLLAINSGRTARCTPQERSDMTLVEDVTAWVLGCGAEAAAQPGSGGGVTHTHGETELRFNGGEAARKRRGSHSHTHAR